jgi:cation diffusion facilitator CzcD-associated flavoprotein CzcO
MRPIEVIGQNGQSLDRVWLRRPRAYLTVGIPQFPNFFMLNGPYSPVGNFPLIEVAELQMDYILQLVECLRTHRCRAIAPTESSTERFDCDRIVAAKRTVWATGCNSWYIDVDGVPAAWPWTIEKFYTAMTSPDLSDYEQTQ